MPEPTDPTEPATRVPFRERATRERGVVVIWFALMLTVLMGFAGFAVDLSNWWLQAERLQRAADAGAHGGVVFLPGDVGGATTIARGEVAKNGFRSTGADQNATVIVTQEPNPNRLRVEVTTTVDTFFAGLLGVDSVTLTREAVAEYIAPVPMGSPENKLGNDPARGQNSPQFWINVAGPNSRKAAGDRYQAKRCPSTTAGCGSGPEATNNLEYAEDGYFYSLDVRNRPSGEPLMVQVYDPAMTYVGDKCEHNMPTATQNVALQALPGNPYPDAMERFEAGLTVWCTGDQDINGRTTETTFIVREPDDTPWSDTDNPVISECTVTMPAFTPGQNGHGSIYQMLDPNVTTSAPTVQVQGVTKTFGELFRQNVTICEIPAAQVQEGEYILQIRSNARRTNPLVYDPTYNPGGHNRMSIQAGFGDAGLAVTNGSNVTINARGKLPMYANATNASTTFYLARVLPYDAGRTLRVNLYDISDVDGSGSMQIQPPAELGGAFGGCGFANDTNKSMSYNAGTCTLTVPRGYYDQRTVTVDIPIPIDYSCNPNVGTECWITVLADFTGPVQDTTTWSASILGNPIRLVE